MYLKVATNCSVSFNLLSFLPLKLLHAIHFFCKASNSFIRRTFVVVGAVFHAGCHFKLKRSTLDTNFMRSFNNPLRGRRSNYLCLRILQSVQIHIVKVSSFSDVDKSIWSLRGQTKWNNLLSFHFNCDKFESLLIVAKGRRIFSNWIPFLFFQKIL